MRMTSSVSSSAHLQTAEPPGESTRLTHETVSGYFVPSSSPTAANMDKMESVVNRAGT